VGRSDTLFAFLGHICPPDTPFFPKKPPFAHIWESISGLGWARRTLESHKYLVHITAWGTIPDFATLGNYLHCVLQKATGDEGSV